MTRTPIATAKAGYGNQVWKIKPGKKDGQAHPCLWMQAGAVDKKDCTHFYDCSNCKYNSAMETLVAKGKQMSWQDSIRLRTSFHGPCRHTLTQRFENKLCPFNYQCSHCAFDQLFEEVFTPKATSAANVVHNVKGFDVPEGYYFHNGHTWARIESGGCIRIGLDDFSLKVLGEPDVLDLPLMGKELNAGKAGWGLRRGGNSADVLSPINGVIMEVNQKVKKSPVLATRWPYSDGWLFSVQTNDIKASLKALMVDADTISWISDEVGVLESMIEEVSGPLAADGGYLRADVFGNLPSLGWENLTQRFLRS